MALVPLSSKNTLVCLLCSLAALLTLTSRAQAQEAEAGGWEICNQTSYIIEAATARYEDQGSIVDGWVRLRPGTCEVALPAPLTPGVHYLFGRSSPAHRGGQKLWTGETEFCVDPTGSFSIESLPDCRMMGLEARQFQAVLIEDVQNWRTNFTETETWTLEQASAAGVQRLLDNASVYSGRIDGFLGRRTRAAIGDFLAQKNLNASTSDADLLDILEQTAIQRSRNIGLTFCNRTDKRIWSAMARRRGEDWESRGWWLLEAGGCARVIDEPLLQAELYAYAEMEQGTGKVSVLKRGQTTFCVSRAKFAITGRESCEAASYRSGLFVPTPPPENRRLVFEFFERDFETPDNAG